MNLKSLVHPIDLQTTFEALPGNHVILLPNAPTFTIVGATDSFLKTSYRTIDDIIGRPLFEVFPDDTTNEKATGVLNLRSSLEYVIVRKETHQMADQRYDIVNPQTGGFEFKVWAASNKPLLDSKGAVQYIIHTTEDITERKKSEKLLKDNESLLRTIIDASPNSLSVFEPVLNDKGDIEDLRFVMVNEFTVQTTGRADLVGKLYGVEFPHVKQTGVLKAFIEVGKTGVPTEFEKWYEGESLRHWFRFIVNKVGKLVVATVEDITKRKESEKAIQESEQYARSLFYNSPVAMLVYIGPDMVLRQANEKMLQIFGRGEEIIGKPIMESIPELKNSPLLGYYRTVFETGTTHHQFAERVLLMKAGQPYHGYYNYTYKPLFNSEDSIYGVICTCIDVTEQVSAQKKVEESEVRFRTMAESTPVLVAMTDETGNAIYFNKAWTDVTGRPMQELLEYGWVDLLHPEDKEQFLKIYLDAFAVKGPFTGELRVLNPQGKYRWLLAHGAARFDTEGQFVGFISACTDITEQKSMQQQLLTALEQVRLSKEAAELGTFDLDLEKGTMHWDDRCRALFGIHHQLPVSYEKDFVGGLHPDDRHRILNAIDHSFKKSDSNGDYDVEYRTVSAENGIIRWVRAKGKVYFNSEEKPIRFIGSVLDITEKVTAIQKIEALVDERTKELAHTNEILQNTNKELQRSNQNLEEFAHAASHDLKEPVRKIHFFTNQLKGQLSSQLQDEQVRAFSRIENATERMSNLIDDLLLYSHVSHRPHENENVDLNQKLQRVLEDLELDIEEKAAKVQVGKLPVIKGYPRQLQQLFQNLISNAVKYSKVDVPPCISINASEILENGQVYYMISFQDNGIGFEPEYADKIFQMFTRLHGKAEYSGTGVGLSIVKKVVENHNGLIRVESTPREGSTFKVLIPA